MASPRIVVIRWQDAHGTKEETMASEILIRHRPCEYWSCGVLIKSDKEGVSLSLDYGLPLESTDGFSYRDRSFIPRVLILDEFDAGPLIRKIRSKRGSSLKDLSQSSAVADHLSPSPTVQT
jgi:hypothetical protein